MVYAATLSAPGPLGPSVLSKHSHPLSPKKLKSKPQEQGQNGFEQAWWKGKAGRLPPLLSVAPAADLERSRPDAESIPNPNRRHAAGDLHISPIAEHPRRYQSHDAVASKSDTPPLDASRNINPRLPASRQQIHADKDGRPLAKNNRTLSEPLLSRFFQGMRGKKSVDQSGSAGKVAPVPHTEKRRLLTPASSAPRIAAQQQAPPLPNESVGPYIILKTLGTGGFSHVKLAVHIRDGKRVALKMLEKPRSVKQGQANGHGPESEQLQTAIDQAHREAALIESLKHPHIIRLLTTFETETHSCLVLEYIPNSDLYELMTAHPASLTEAFIKRIFSEMCSAVAHLHRNNICHRDIKIENILVDSDTGVKLTDFGLATRFTPGVLLTDRCGSEEYVAPEVIKALPYDGRKTDVWALGIILFALLTGELPFNVRPGSTLRSMFHRIATGSYKFPPPQPGRPPVSDLAKDLIRKILTTNPVKRPSVEEVLSHPWLAQTVTGR